MESQDGVTRQPSGSAVPAWGQPRRRAPWHVVYFALAAFDVLAVASGLYLSHRIMTIYTDSVTENRLWAQRLGSFHRLNDLAAAANAPGNDVFDSGDPGAEKARRDEALAAFARHLAEVREDCETITEPDRRERLQRALDQVDAAMAAMVELADGIFALFAAGAGDQAGQYMATMDRRYAEVTRLVSAATASIQEVQSDAFITQLTDAEALRRFEYGIGVLIVLMVGGVIAYGQKIKRVMAEDERAIAEALQREYEAMAQQRRFVAVAAHEFRTPLTIIDGAAQRLIRNADRADPADLRERATKIRLATARMAEIVDRTLSAARLDERSIDLRLATIDLAALMREVCARQAAASPDFTIDIAAGDPGPQVLVDRQLLDLVLTNLVSNAIKYSGHSRRIEVVVRGGLGFAHLSVRDYGVGIPAAEIPRLFTRFYRASTAKGIAGTGIGLSLVKEIASLHGGSIDVWSALGVGSRFTLTLPAATTTAAEAPGSRTA